MNFEPRWMRKKFSCIKCDSIDGKGCGNIWLEGFNLYHLCCQKCGRLCVDGNIIVNDENTPNLNNLDNPNVLVVWDETE